MSFFTFANIMTVSEIHDIKKYCESLTDFKRFRTREVSIGKLKMGADNPIRIQSMTTTDTMDTQATVEQSIRMIEAGCELVRITAPSKREAENLENIKNELRARGYDTPICADIHFTPNAAEIAAKLVEKVRVNPGNYADSKKFKTIEYNDESYQEELERIRKRFTPLVRLCKEHGTAMRIGTNHGSLSDRILSRYGDTPKGMVESAMEFLRICEDEGFHNIVLSMKASNTQVMVQAYRVLVQQMKAEGMNYPLHLGVTEAGEGEDGRIKSAVGIGTLLEDGLGDTIRVSLTEEPEAECPVAEQLANKVEGRKSESGIPPIDHYPIDPFAYQRRTTYSVLNIGDHNVPVVLADLSGKQNISQAGLFPFGYRYSVPLDKWNIADLACDYIFVGDKQVDFEIPGTLGVVQDYATWERSKARHYPIVSVKEFELANDLHDKLNFLSVNLVDLNESLISKLKDSSNIVLLIEANSEHRMAELRRAFIELMNHDCNVPVVIKGSYHKLEEEKLQLYASADIGGLLIDGLGDGIMISAAENGSDAMVNALSFGILQATRTRISKTEYISCPSCGRTLFDLQETTARIRERTSHLKGVKIGIMGCIVNGPGEMADADYGYVGTGVGKISLYKEKKVVKRAIPTEEAVDALIDLIKEHGDWVEPVQE